MTELPLSSLLPYEIAGRHRGPLVAHARPGCRGATYPTILREGAARVPVFDVRVGGVQGALLATVEATGWGPEHSERDPVFDPWNTGPELQPTGMLNRLRRPTYAASRQGRGREPDSSGATSGGRGHTG